MTGDEWRAFLREPPRPAMLATVRSEAFGRRNAVDGELLVRVTPVRVVARKNISD